MKHRQHHPLEDAISTHKIAPMMRPRVISIESLTTPRLAFTRGGNQLHCWGEHQSRVFGRF